MIPTERTSSRANASVASAEIIGVRRVVSAAPSSNATGWPMRMSNSTYTPWMIGSPRAGLAGWMPTSFTPAASPAAAGITRNSPPPARQCTRSTCDGDRREAGAQRIERVGQRNEAEQLVGVEVRQGALHQSDHGRPATVRACLTTCERSPEQSTMTVRLVAGVDSSTQSTKVEVRDLDTGEVVARGSAPHPATTPPRSEQDPEAWWSAFETAWAAAGSPQVEAISVAGQQHGMVVLDADRQVVRPAKLWNDTETAPDAGWLVKQLPGGAADWAAAVGSVPVAALHRRQAELAAPQRARELGQGRACRAAARLDDDAADGRARHRSRRRLRHRATGRRRRASTDGTSCRSSTRISTGPPSCRGSPGRPRWSASGTARRSRAAPATTWPPRSASVCSRASPCCRSARRAPRTPSAMTPTAGPDRRGGRVRRRQRFVPAAGLHAQRHQGHRCGCPAARRRSRRVRSPGARVRRRAPAA